jgi:hypothetical protein
LAVTAGRTENGTLAERRAARNWSANLAALAQTQAWLIERLQGTAAGVEWVLGREGYLTCRDGEKWWSDCSLPLRAAQYMMRTLEPGASMAAMLWPAHAAQVRVALDRLARWQGVIVLLPESRALRIMLACDDFSREIRLHRLWFAGAEKWEADLQRLLEENEGLPTPTQFIRPIAADNAHTDSLVAPAQTIFGSINARRSAQIPKIIQAGLSDCGQSICLIAPSHFRLWGDAGETLASAMDLSPPPVLRGRVREGVRESGACSTQPPPQPSPGVPGEGENTLSHGSKASHVRVTDTNLIRYDPDDPASAAPLALARVAAKSRAIVAAGVGRADLPEVARRDLPWVTWVTTPRVPASERRGPCDRLIVADPAWQKTAIEAGWPAERIAVGGWPLVAQQQTSPAAPVLGIIADLYPPEPPKDVREYSSLTVLWETIAHELAENPLCLTHPDSYLDERMRQAQVSADGLDRKLFIERLIVSSYQRGLAYLLCRAGVAIRCFGIGWDKCAGLVGIARELIESREQLMDAVKNSAALLHCWPAGYAHPIEAMGRPVVKTLGRSREQLLRDVRDAISGKRCADLPRVAPISAGMVEALLEGQVVRKS